MIVAATAHYPSNPIIGVGEIVGIRTIEKKKPRKKKADASNAGTNVEFGGKKYIAVGQFEVQLQDDTVLMTVCWDGKQLTFNYFGMTQDETSSECLNEEYERAIILHALRK